jgi:uncharacterized protein involved in response to NO
MVDVHTERQASDAGATASRPMAVGAEPAVYGLWGRAFRPFFLAGAIHAALVVPWWSLAWLGFVPAPAWTSPTAWHGHEMLFGLVAAAIAGFLLTASPVWSGGPALVGRPLAALVVLWIAGRLAFFAVGVLPAWAVAGIDLAFLPLVAAAVARTLRHSGQRRNQALIGVVLALAAANAAVHADVLGFAPGAASRALRFAADGVVVLILVIGGRITPAFTRNALIRAGIDREVRSRPRLDALAIVAAATLALVTLVLGRTPVTGVLALVAGAAAALRMAGWQTRHTRSDPLLWSLHAGLLWVAVGLVLVGAGDLGAPIPASAGLHALTAGAMGSMILAVMTRVGLGHTGRPLELGRGVVWCYVLVGAAAVARVAAPFAAADGQRALLLGSGLAWAIAFGLFVARYWPILTRPRPDGLPG